jgi:imidazolonepropionase
VAAALLIRNASEIVWVHPEQPSSTRAAGPAAINRLQDASILIEEGRITWIGPTREIPFRSTQPAVINATGKTALPGLIDSHTHLVFAGAREFEFEERIRGTSYQEIAARGGGIAATVDQVRRTSRAGLAALTRQRLDRLLSHGVTTVEVKSGYGLSLADELKCLEVIADLNAEGPLELVPTVLGAHAVPREFAQDRAAYLRLLMEELLPEVARSRLAEFCDVFCEEGVFSVPESEQILRRAKALGLGLKIHADELSPSGGAELAAGLGAVSADHLLRVSDRGIDALARAGTVATLLPGTAFFLGLTPAPARKLLAAGVRVALASDCNPGTCPTENLPLVGTMACTQMKMTPAEVLAGLTCDAAAAIGRSGQIGSLQPGMQADLVLLDLPNFLQMLYHFGANHVWRVIKRGQVIYEAPPPYCPKAD